MNHGGRARSHVYRTIGTVHAAVASSVMTLGWVVLALIPGRAEIAGYVCAPLFAAWTWPAWRMGVRVDTEGVKVTGYLVTKRVYWRDVERFAVLPAGPYPYVGHLIRTGGRRPIVIMGISTGRGKTEKHRLEAQRPIDELNEQLVRWQAQETT